MNNKIDNKTMIIQNALEKAKKIGYTNSDFLFDYERELACIVIGVKKIQEGCAPRVVESLILQLYPDKDIDSMFG